MFRFDCKLSCVLAALCVSVSVPAFANDVESGTLSAAPAAGSVKNAVYFELGGNGVLYSLNYERFVTEDIGIRVGAGYYSVSANDLAGDAHGSATIAWLPILVDYLGFGHENHRLELGAGLVPIYAGGAVESFNVREGSSGVFLAGTASIAYRYIPRQGGVNFKFGLTPLIGTFGVVPWLGLGVGATF